MRTWPLGQESESVLLVVRANTSQRMELLEWHRIEHGKHGRTICYSRTMLCRIYTDDSVGQLGSSHTCRIIHLHRHLANGYWPNRLVQFFNWLAVAANDTDVLMGDFNMALFLVVPQLRQRQVIIDLTAWFPWKLPNCTPMVDSCAIFFINRPGIYHLKNGQERLHAKNPLGIYWDQAANDAAVAAGDPGGTGDFIVMGLDGPGFPFKTYIPKDGKVYPLVEETLRPTLSPEEVKERSAHGRRWKITPGGFQVSARRRLSHRQGRTLSTLRLHPEPMSALRPSKRQAP